METMNAKVAFRIAMHLGWLWVGWFGGGVGATCWSALWEEVAFQKEDAHRKGTRSMAQKREIGDWSTDRATMERALGEIGEKRRQEKQRAQWESDRMAPLHRGENDVVLDGMGIGESRSPLSNAQEPDKQGPKVSGSISASMLDYPIVTGSLDKKSVYRVIRSHRREIAQCYEKYLVNVGFVRGSLVFEFVLANTGEVTSTQVKSSTFQNDDLEDCICREVLRWTFPEPKKSETVSIIHRFVFRVDSPQ